MMETSPMNGEPVSAGDVKIEIQPHVAIVESSRPISNRDLRKNRAIMTLLHFVLTYPKFSVSLFVFFASITTPLPSSYEKVWAPVANLRSVVYTEAELYHQCVAEGFSLEDRRMDRAATLEQNRVYEQHVSVLQPLISNAATVAAQCFNATHTAQLALQTWELLGQVVPRSYNITTIRTSTCTDEDQKLLSKMLSEDVMAARSRVQTSLNAYMNASLSTAHKLVRYGQERGSYDYNYFIGIKLPSLFHAIDKFAPPNVYLTLPEQRLVFQLKGVLKGMIEALQLAYGHIETLSLRLSEFHMSLQAFHHHYTDLYGRFELIGTFVRDFLPSGMALPDYFDISGVPLAGSLLPPNFEIPALIGDLPMIEDLVSEYISEAIRLVSQFLQEAAEEASEQTRDAVEALLAFLKELIILEDYNPPQYPTSDGVTSPEDELAHLERLANQTEKDASQALQDLIKRHDSTPEFKPIEPSVDVVPPTVGERDQTSFSFLDLTYPAFSVPVWIMAVIGFVCSRTFLIECLTQAIRLYRLKKKYEAKASPELPEIDYVHEDDDEKEKENDEFKPSKLQVAQAMMLKHMMNPWVICGLMMIPSIVAVLIFWFPHVKRTCIDSRRGTFLARNIFTQIQVNKANSQGFALHVLAQQDCRRRQRSICSTMSSKSDAAYRNNIATLFALQKSLNESNSVGGVIKRCVDTSSLDEQISTNCCGLEGYTRDDECPLSQIRQFCPIDLRATPPSSFRPVGEIIYEPACAVDLDADVINAALFNCSVLEESCNEIPCTGVDSGLIEDMTIEADCSVEIYAIHFCIFIVLAIYHAVMVNWVNTLMFNGILQLRWRSLKPEGIKMITHVNLHGELVKGSELQERTGRVDRAMRKYVLAGYLQIGLSIGIFMFWLLTVVILRKVIARFTIYNGE